MKERVLAVQQTLWILAAAALVLCILGFPFGNNRAYLAAQGRKGSARASRKPSSNTRCWVMHRTRASSSPRRSRRPWPARASPSWWQLTMPHPCCHVRTCSCGRWARSRPATEPRRSKSGCPSRRAGCSARVALVSPAREDLADAHTHRAGERERRRGRRRARDRSRDRANRPWRPNPRSPRPPKTSTAQRTSTMHGASGTPRGRRC